jgi:hypothetical protein
VAFAHYINSGFYWVNNDFWASNWFNPVHVSTFLMTENKNQYRDLLLSLLLLGLIYWYKRWDEIIIIALVFILLGLAFSHFRFINHLLWKWITRFLQLVFQPIIGAMIFFVFLTPIGLLSQLFKKKKTYKDSTFVNVDEQFDQEFFKKQW